MFRKKQKTKRILKKQRLLYLSVGVLSRFSNLTAIVALQRGGIERLPCHGGWIADFQYFDFYF